MYRRYYFILSQILIISQKHVIDLTDNNPSPKKFKELTNSFQLDIKPTKVSQRKGICAHKYIFNDL